MVKQRARTLSTIESLVLDLLESHTRCGQELVEASSGGLKRGSVYVTLARMEVKGFAESYQEERQAGAIGMPRRLYRATPYGLKVRDASRLLRAALAFKPADAPSRSAAAD
jgi:PadR family transcriptional regulator, regulatory protein PadR